MVIVAGKIPEFHGIAGFLKDLKPAMFSMYLYC